MVKNALLTDEELHLCRVDEWEGLRIDTEARVAKSSITNPNGYVTTFYGPG